MKMPYRVTNLKWFCSLKSQIPSVTPVCVVEQKDKAEPFDVEEVVQEMPRDQREALWGKLASLLQDVLLELPPDRWEQGEEEDMEVDSNADPVSR